MCRAELVQHGLMPLCQTLGRNGRPMRQRATGDPNGMRERERVWVPRVRPRTQRRLVHQRAKGKVREEKAPRFLAHRAGVLLRSTRCAPRKCVLNSSNVVSISQRS